MNCAATAKPLDPTLIDRVLLSAPRRQRNFLLLFPSPAGRSHQETDTESSRCRDSGDDVNDSPRLRWRRATPPWRHVTGAIPAGERGIRQGCDACRTQPVTLLHHRGKTRGPAPVRRAAEDNWNPTADVHPALRAARLAARITDPVKTTTRGPKRPTGCPRTCSSAPSEEPMVIALSDAGHGHRCP